MKSLTNSQIDRLWAMADGLSFELDGSVEETKDKELEELKELANKIYEKLDEERCRRMKNGE